MIWKKICGMNKIGSMRATLQVLDLLEHILSLRLDKKLVDETSYKIINNYLTEIHGDFYASLGEEKYKEKEGNGVQVTVSVPKDVYEEICSGKFDTDGYFKLNLSEAFKNGTRLS